MRKGMAALAMVVLMAGAVSVAHQRGPSTPQERAAVLELIAKLQDNPLDPGLQSERDHLVIVVVEAPDLNPITCADQMPWVQGKFKYANELSVVHLLAAAAYIIQNGAKRDEKAAHLAGLQGAIRAYQAMVRQNRKLKWQPMEDLVNRDLSGELAKLEPGFCKRS